MQKRVLLVGALLTLALAAPLAAQTGGRVHLVPFAAYGLFGSLPDDTRLRRAPAYGLRASLGAGAGWALFGSYQRARPAVAEAGSVLGAGPRVRVDHWSVGVEHAYRPAGKPRALPLVLEAGAGQARYGGGGNADLAVVLGMGSALHLGERAALRFGVSGHISRFRGLGSANHRFLHLGLDVAL